MIKSRLAKLFLITIFFLILSVPAGQCEAVIRASYYVSTVCHRIKRHWNPPSNYAGQRVIVSFRVHRNGSISDITCKAYNDPQYLFYKAAIKAVRDSFPLPRPSAEFFLPGHEYTLVSVDMSAFYNARPSVQQRIGQSASGAIRR